MCGRSRIFIIGLTFRENRDPLSSLLFCCFLLCLARSFPVLVLVLSSVCCPQLCLLPSSPVWFSPDLIWPHPACLCLKFCSSGLLCCVHMSVSRSLCDGSSPPHAAIKHHLFISFSPLVSIWPSQCEGPCEEETV